MKRVFVSMPMSGLSKEEIDQNFQKCRKRIEKFLNGEEYQILDSYIKEEIPEDTTNEGIWYLAKSLEILSKADVAYFAEGWKTARGCRIEHRVAMSYGEIDIIEE